MSFICVHSFSPAIKYSLCDYTTIYVFVLQLVNMWIISSLGFVLLSGASVTNYHKNRDAFSHISSKCLTSSYLKTVLPVEGTRGESVSLLPSDCPGASRLVAHRSNLSLSLSSHGLLSLFSLFSSVSYEDACHWI